MRNLISNILHMLNKAFYIKNKNILFYKIRKNERTIDMLKKALERKISYEEELRLMYYIGLYYYKEENYFDAHTYFELIRDNKTTNNMLKGKYIYKIGDIYYNHGDYGKASTYFEEYLKLCIGIKTFLLNKRSLLKISKALIYSKHIEKARFYYIILRETKHCKKYKNIEKILEVW